MRGYFGIGVLNPKHQENIGTLWRHAYLFGAAYIFTIGRRYQTQASDTTKTMYQIPLYHYVSVENFFDHRPVASPLVVIEQSPLSRPLNNFIHPPSCTYLLGAEDHGVPQKVIDRAQFVVEVPTPHAYSMNVAGVGTVVMYDRYVSANLGTKRMSNVGS